MEPNFDNCSDIKGIRFFSKEIGPYYCRFLHTQKDSGGASIHRIDESFPLKPSLEVKCTKDFHVLNTEDQLQNSFTGRSQCCDWLKYFEYWILGTYFESGNLTCIFL